MKEYNTKPAAGVQKIETLGGDYALKWDDESAVWIADRKTFMVDGVSLRSGAIAAAR